MMLAAVFALASNAHATFIGDQVVLSGATGFAGSQIITVVDGVDTTIVDGRISVDIGADTIDLFSNGGFVGTLFEPGDFLRFDDLDPFGTAGSIVGVIFNEVGVTGESLVTFGADWVNIDFNSSVWSPNFAHLTIQLQTAIVAMPEPAPLALLGLGLVGIWRARRPLRAAAR